MDGGEEKMGEEGMETHMTISCMFATPSLAARHLSPWPLGWIETSEAWSGMKARLSEAGAAAAVAANARLVRSILRECQE